MRWDFAMPTWALVRAFAVAVAMTGAAAAQTDAGKGAAEGGVPTVTILNKAPAGPAGETAPALTVSPSRTAAPAGAAPAAEAPKGAEAPKDGSGAASDSKAADAAGAPQKPEAAAEPAPLPAPTLAIDIDLGRQVMTVSEDGAKLYTWRISSARYGYRTPTGTYRPTWMAKMWYSRQYDLAPMPHAIFFHKGVAIHATYDTAALGRPASHGCVRLAPKNAAALFKLVTRHGKERTEIVVHGRPDYSSPQVAAAAPRGAREPERLRRGSGAYRYLPPSYYGRRYAYDPDDYYYPPPRTRRYYAAPRRPPRGFYSEYPYGYGF